MDRLDKNHPDEKTLGLEKLARLIDETPTLEELEVLENSPELRAELKELRAQTEALGSLPDIRPPRGDWEALEARLASEGLIQARRFRSLSFFIGSGWSQIAAALILFLGGTFMGSQLGGSDSPSLPAGMDIPAMLASMTQASTPEEASLALEVAETAFVNAWLQYRQFTPLGSEDSGQVDESRRFLALEEMIRAGQSALRHAPTDPFLNGMLVNAVAEREALLRQVSASTQGSWY